MSETKLIYSPDLPSTTIEVEKFKNKGYQALYDIYKRNQRNLLRQRLKTLVNNIYFYVAKTKEIGIPTKETVVFEKAIAGARIIPAHASRYMSKGLNTDNVIGFVVHRPGLDPKASTLENIIVEFTQPNSAKAAVFGLTPSAHFAVGQQGELIQFVDLNDLAPHASGEYLGSTVNTTFIGTELEGHVGAPISTRCYDRLAELIATLSLLCPNMVIDEQHIVEHRELPAAILAKAKYDKGQTDFAGLKFDVGAPFNKKYLISLIKEKRSNLSSVAFVEKTYEAVTLGMAENISALTAYGNALGGITAEQAKQQQEDVEKYVRYSQQSINTVPYLSLSSIAFNDTMAKEALNQTLNNMNILDAPVDPSPVIGGIYADFKTGTPRS